MAALVIGLSIHSSTGRNSSTASARPTSPVTVTRLVFGRHWRAAWCIAYYESRHRLAARNGANLGPWQINVTAHPWAHPWLLTHSWRYSARVAYRISHHGTDWRAWTTHSLCGV